MSYTQAVRVKGEQNPIKDLPIDLKFPLYEFQRRGVLFLYAAKKCLLADSTGLGKTVMSLGLFKLIEKANKEDNRWIVVVPANALFQWEREFKIFTNYFPYVAVGDRQERILRYIGQSYQFIILSYNTLWTDWEVLNGLKVKNWLFDDAHYFKHHDTKTAKLVKELTTDADRVVLTTATPIQKSLMDIHSLFETLNLNAVFGNQYQFKSRYCIFAPKILKLRGGRTIRTEKIVGVKNVDDFQRRAYPFFIKRTFKDVGNQLPMLMVRPVWLGLHKEQRDIYKQKSKDLIQAWDSGIVKNLQNKGFHSVMQILGGTKTLGLDMDVSVKLDFIDFFVREKINRDDKVIIYSFYKNTVKAISDRLKSKHIGHVCVSGEDGSEKKERKRLQFMENPDIQVLVGTGAIEVAMNLQRAKYMIMVDLVFNPQRIVQLVGRMRRLGSTHKNVVLYVLLTKDTIEERIWKNLHMEATINDLIFKERSDVFKQLSDGETIGFLRT